MSAQPPIEVRRHYSELSEEETNAVVGTVADLLVNYLKKTGFAQAAAADSEATGECPAETMEVRS